jgi:3-hydroxyisobutyrate dehydrogenase
MRVGLIGFGEVGRGLARDLAARGVAMIGAYDIKFGAGFDPGPPVPGLILGRDPAEAVDRADLVFVAVTAGATLEALGALAGVLGHRPFVVDVNSVAPATKREGAALVEAAGGRYVEAAIMSAIAPRGLASPMLLGGPHAADFVQFAGPLAMVLTVHAGEIGPASSVKMCRSIMIKGLEALALESMLAARRYGVEADVLRSLGDMLPHENWPRLARYFISRALQHGRRRAEEMREVARTVSDAGIEPLVSRAIAQRQDWAADRAADLDRAALQDEDLARLLDALLAVIDEGAAATSASSSSPSPRPRPA